jgi:antirestriction protein ArdC
MKNVSSYLTAPVNKLLKALDVQTVLYSELDTKDLPKYLVPCIKSAEGFYDGTNDVIGLKDNQKNADEVILHELIHFTGSKERLNRSWIVNNTLACQNLPHEEQTDEDRQTEEATAQIGMLKLALVLGLNPARFTDCTHTYVSRLTKADLEKADRDSDKAVEYLVRVVGMERVA